MKREKTLIISNNENNLTRCFEQIDDLIVDIISFDKILATDLSMYDSFIILGSSKSVEEGVIFDPITRNALENQRNRGARFFCEYCQSFGNMYSTGMKNSSRQRLLFLDKKKSNKIPLGSLLDDYSNNYFPQAFKPIDARLILARCGQPIAHNKIHAPVVEEILVEDWALWVEKDLMFCSFPLTNFVDSRFAPFDYWKSIVSEIISWTCKLDEQPDLAGLERAYSFLEPSLETKDDIENMIKKAVKWFTESRVINENGRLGIKEGLSSEIHSDGEQSYSEVIRTDCTGETALSLFMYDKLFVDKDLAEISNRLEKFCFEEMIEKEKGILNGMIRWSNMAWGVNYGDDSARFLISILYKMKYSGNIRYLSDIQKSIDFLVRTTGPDGLRVARTDNYKISSKKDVKLLADVPGNFPSAHYNAYFHAAILLYGIVSGDLQYQKVAVNGLHNIMQKYPNTLREHSETQEQCRLVLPLALLYESMPSKQHKDYLYRVCNDLQKHKTTKGAYLEWDTGYSAAFSHKNGTESSLLAKNGNPICDLLYSINWLPLGFTAAYVATKDKWFKDLWKELALFLSSIQINSQNSMLDGAWARGIDVEKMEVFAMPNDVGWGPWAIETGWTMAEIVSGLEIGLMELNIV